MKLCIVLDVDDDDGIAVLRKSRFPYKGQLDSLEFGTIRGIVQQVAELPRVELIQAPGRKRKFGIGR